MPPKMKTSEISERSFKDLTDFIPNTSTGMTQVLKRLGQLSSSDSPPPQRELRSYFMELSEAKNKDDRFIFNLGKGLKVTMKDIEHIIDAMGFERLKAKSKTALLEKAVKQVEDVVKPAQPAQPSAAASGPATVKDLSSLQKEAFDKTGNKANDFFDKMKANSDALEKTIPEFDNNFKDPYNALLVMRQSMGDPRVASGIIKTFTEQVAVPAMIGTYNWCGPATDIFQNVIEARGWTNELDRACMLHDLEYLVAGSSQTPQSEMSKRVKEADDNLVKRANEINARLMAKNPQRGSKEFDLAGDAQKVSGIIFAASALGITKMFASEPQRPMPISVLNQIDNEIKEIAAHTADIAMESKLPFAQDLVAAYTAIVFADDEEQATLLGEQPKAAEEEVKETEEDPVVDPADVDPAAADPEVAETTPVLDEALLESVVPPRPEVQLSPEEIKAASMEKVGEPLVGERAMRPMIFREEGDTVEPSNDERKQNLLWLENFNWIDEGHGNGNQQRVPWEFGGGLSKNTLFNAQQRNEIVKYSGNLYVGPQHIRKKKEMSDLTKFMMTQTMTPTTQNRQRFIRNGALPAGLGRPIKMYRNNELIPFARRYEKDTRLVHPDVVDNVRV